MFEIELNIKVASTFTLVIGWILAIALNIVLIGICILELERYLY